MIKNTRSNIYEETTTQIDNTYEIQNPYEALNSDHTSETLNIYESLESENVYQNLKICRDPSGFDLPVCDEFINIKPEQAQSLRLNFSYLN